MEIGKGSLNMDSLTKDVVVVGTGPEFESMSQDLEIGMLLHGASYSLPFC